jgi:L-amino acid N-acyltransferase YncA
MIRSGVLTKHRGQGMQKRLIRARIAMAKRHGFKQIVTYVLDWNLASANSLIACGFRLYIPESKYAGSKAFYFQKMLVGKQ